MRVKSTYYIIAAKVAKYEIRRKEIFMSKKFFKLFLTAALLLALLGSVAAGASGTNNGGALPCLSGYSNVSRASALQIVSVSRQNNVDLSGLTLYVGGVPFGVKFMTEGVIVTGMTDVTSKGVRSCPASDAGLRVNDVITEINGEPLLDAQSLSDLAENSGGRSMSVTYSRNGEKKSTSITPKYCDSEKKYKTGLYVRDSGAGIGTVTYIMPDTLSFGGLGHGICDAGTGRLLPMQRGSVVGVTINGVVKGVSGTPGEVKGYFSSGKTGTLLENTTNGVFGVFASLPEGLPSEPIPVGGRNEIKAGKAYIYCTLDGTTPERYEIQISEIRRDSMSNKCFNVKVTDKSLIEKSGGIVQGMSGSPIIQNGKLVGAVTHVLVNDPTAGYGIFIENMLNTARMPMQKAA